jgi:hypothetical protein
MQTSHGVEMIEAGKTYVFTKSGNEVKALEKSKPYMGKECWTVERTKGASAGKRMVVPRIALVSVESFAAQCE